MGLFHSLARILPRDRSGVFLQAVPVHASRMLHSEDPDDVMRHYAALKEHIAGFATRNTIAVAAGLVPVVALFLLTGALYLQERRTNIVEVSPAIAIRGLPASLSVVKTRGGGILIDRQKVGSGLAFFGETLDSNALASKHAFCHGWLDASGMN